MKILSGLKSLLNTITANLKNRFNYLISFFLLKTVFGSVIDAQITNSFNHLSQAAQWMIRLRNGL